MHDSMNIVRAAARVTPLCQQDRVDIDFSRAHTVLAKLRGGRENQMRTRFQCDYIVEKSLHINNTVQQRVYTAQDQYL